MLGRKRLYFMLPDVRSARSMVDELLLARIEIGHMRFWAKDGTLPEDIPDASFWFKTDLTHGAELGMLTGGVLGMLGGLWLVSFPPEWVQLNGMAIVVTSIVGIILGGWMSSMVAMAIPNSRLKNFLPAIEAGAVLMIVDVPFRRLGQIEELISRYHPEASFGGVEPHIPVFP